MSGTYPNGSMIIVSFNEHRLFSLERGRTYDQDMKYNFKNIKIKLK